MLGIINETITSESDMGEEIGFVPEEVEIEETSDGEVPLGEIPDWSDEEVDEVIEAEVII